MSNGTVIPERPQDGGSERLEFFSDAIMAIAITLLVIEIKIPDGPGTQLGAALRHLWPSYLAYALSFCTIGLIWVAHHSMFRRIADVDRQLLLINLSLMACVAFLPFSTAVLAQYSWSNPGAPVAVELYSLNMLAIGLAFLGLWVYLAGHRYLFIGDVTRESVLSAIRRSLFPPVAYAISCSLAFVSPQACYAIWVATTIYIIIGPAARRIAVWSSSTPDNAESETAN